MTETGERPNDIMLPASDRAISRSHCMIVYDTFFRRHIKDKWMAFLMAEHPRVGRKSAFRNLPAPLFREVLQFLFKPRVPFLIDLGSVCGTYLKVSNVTPVEIRQGQNFLVGSDIIIDIERVENMYAAQAANFEGQEDQTFSDTDLAPLDSNPFILVSIYRMH